MRHKDKIWHFAISTILTVVFYYYIKNWFYVFLIVMGLSLTKEFYDHFKKNKNTYTESALDLLADGIGFLAVFAICNYLLK